MCRCAHDRLHKAKGTIREKVFRSQSMLLLLVSGKFNDIGVAFINPDKRKPANCIAYIESALPNFGIIAREDIIRGRPYIT